MPQGTSHFAPTLQYLVVFPGLTVHGRDHGHVELAQSSVVYGTTPIARFPVDRRIVVAPSAMSLETATQERLVGFHNAVQQPKSDPTQTSQESMAPAKDRGRRHRQLGMDREAFHRTEIVAQKPRVGTPLIGMPKTRKGRSRQRIETPSTSALTVGATPESLSTPTVPTMQASTPVTAMRTDSVSIHHLGSGLQDPMTHCLVTALSSQTLDLESLRRGQFPTERGCETPKIPRIHG